MKKLHRTVVLPEYQGIGVARILQNEVCEIYKNKGFRVTTTTSHFAMIRCHKNDKKWKLTRHGRVGKISSSGVVGMGKSTNRLTTSWEYVGDKNEK